MERLTSTITVNVDVQIKDEAECILKELGLNMSIFINMALAQVVKRNGIPFEVNSTEEVNEMISNPRKYPRYNNWKDLKKSLLDD